MGKKRSATCYTHGMFKTLRRVRKLGLPETLFDADFKEQEEVNRERHAQLLERLRKLEASDEWAGVELPWTKAREEFEKETAEGEEIGYVVNRPGF